MSTTVEYKGNVLTTVNNETRTLLTSGKYLEGNISVTDVTKVAVKTDPVKFIDYDGTILHSYSVSDFMALSAMPSNPTHSGLTSQGWNWSLADAKTQLTKYPEAGLTIGQMYITDDGKTRLYVHFEEGRLHPYLGICPNGTVVVDWGDNSATSTITGDSLTTVKYADHEYASAGDYVITLTVSSGSFVFYSPFDTSTILNKDISVTLYIHRVYTNCLQKVELGSNVSIGSYAFGDCSSLTSITIPDGVTSIGSYAFYYCYSLASITIPDGVTSIGSNAFTRCTSLTSITIPDGVPSIGTNTFSNCSSLTSITIPDSVTSISNNAFSNCYSLASITIPDSVASIGNNAFMGCYALASITIPDGVPSIGSNMFSNCSSLTSITIPDSVTSISSSAFSNCYALASITIPDNVASIGNNAFNNCYGMGEYHILPTTVPTLGTTAFNNIQSDCVIYVPSASLSAYQTANNWSTYASYMQGE